MDTNNCTNTNIKLDTIVSFNTYYSDKELKINKYTYNREINSLFFVFVERKVFTKIQFLERNI